MIKDAWFGRPMGQEWCVRLNSVLALHEMDASLLYEIPAVQKYVQCMGHAAIGLAGDITPYPLFQIYS